MLLALLLLVFPSCAFSSSAVNMINDCDDNNSVASLYRNVILPDAVLLEEILQVSGPFQDSEEEDNCRRMVIEELMEEEQDIAARTSYAYWAWEQLRMPVVKDCPVSSSADDADTAVSSDTEKNETRIRMAMREARRHFVGQGGDFDIALERFKRTVQWRKEARVDLLKSCFSQTVDAVTDTNTASFTTTTIQLSEEEEELCAHYEKLIEADLRIQKMAVRGYDKQNRPIIVKFCRETKWSGEETSDEGFQWAQLYVAERAIAATELRSIGKSEQLTAIFDFSVYDSGNTPPVRVMVETIKVLQANYPERLGKALVLDAPFWMHALMKVVNPFLALKTREKLAVLGTSALPNLWPLRGSSFAEIREETVRAIVDPDQAMPFMLPDAKLTSAIDAAYQLRQVPFYELYDSASPPAVATAES